MKATNSSPGERGATVAAAFIPRSFLARSRMSRVVNLGQRLEVQMRVDLRRRDTCVAEHLLHGAQILGRLQNVTGKRMAKHVRMDRSTGRVRSGPQVQPHCER